MTGNDIHPTAVLGADVTLGTGNVVGPYVVIVGPCEIGDDNWLGPHVSIGGPPAASVAMGGHVRVGAGANLGLGSMVHQRRVIGPGAMLGMGSVVTRDVPPFALAYGSPARVRGANRVGMQRSGITAAVIDALGDRYAEGAVDLAVDGVPADLVEAFRWWWRQTSLG
jgi:UDP-N-acetylglucosamine acyltransferase